MDRQIIGREDRVLWLSRGDLNGETESSGSTGSGLTNQISCGEKKYYKQKQIDGSADSVNNVMRQWITSYLHVQYWQQNDTYRHDSVCVCVCAELHFNVWEETGVKLDNGQWCDYVPESVERSHEYGTNKCEPTELFLAINQIS
jgi:hypothetical protein